MAAPRFSVGQHVTLCWHPGRMFIVKSVSKKPNQLGWYQYGVRMLDKDNHEYDAALATMANESEMTLASQA